MCKKRLDQILGSFSATKQPKSSLLTLLADRGSRGNREGRSQRGRQLDAVLDGGHALLALGLGAGKVKTRMRVCQGALGDSVAVVNSSFLCLQPPCSYKSTSSSCAMLLRYSFSVETCLDIVSAVPTPAS